MSPHDVDTVTSQAIGAADQELVRKQLWGAVTECDEYSAVATMFATVDGGLSPEDVLLEVIAPVQQKTGTEWATAEILTARGVPSATLFPALDLLGIQRHDFPRSRRLLVGAQSALADKKSSATNPQLPT